jgi:hypothetical protein
MPPSPETAGIDGCIPAVPADVPGVPRGYFVEAIKA